ncbi:hypothetical protein [Denitromonas ohlonensis]|uniref:CdiI family contact-dependent growth inhibition immunity protein n=2 Tax=Denitromonas TaxID=139331 RepID=A0A557S1N4_9RHOO|nr:hypothetical protein [Denitromonas ohlonensis]TVO58353.1 hypothetical protein FHP90_20640 [Denitromonas ohlonensis]TVO71276.1 hypothetical protein FHP89_20070 [Denitromonas ohlonensis]
MNRRTFAVLPLLALYRNAMATTNQNEALSDLALMFFQERSTPTYGAHYLNPLKLDFSLASLKHVDEYLERIRKEPEVEKTWNRVVLRTGAYIGEVIRRNSKSVLWQWIGHDDAALIAPKLFDGMPKTIATASVLHDGKAGLTFPLGKVEKYLENGSEDSVHFYAEVMIDRSN